MSDKIVMMGKSQDTAHLTRILLPLLFLVLIIGLLSSSPHHVFAQHEIAPENWIEMRKMFRNKGPIPTLKEDVAALAGGDGKRAAHPINGPRPWSTAGCSCRPKITRNWAITRPSPSSGDGSLLPRKAPFLSFLSSSKKTKKVLCAAMLFYILALLPVTEESAALIIDIATDVNEKWNTREWHAHGSDSTVTHADVVTLSHFARSWPGKTSRRLIVLARLGDKTVLEPISQLLAAGAPPIYEALMLALAEITTPEEFERRAPSCLAWSRRYKNLCFMRDILLADHKKKFPLCLEMLRSRPRASRACRPLPAWKWPRE